MTFIAAALGGMLASLALERPVRNVRAAAIHCALWSLVFLPLAAVSQRSLLAAALALAAHGAVIVVSRAKERALREPLVYADFALFAQALRHPRLYLPYLRPGPALLLVALAGFAVGAAILFEPPSVGPVQWALLLAAAIGVLALVREPVSLDPNADVARLGHLACAWLYSRAERAPLPEPVSPFAAALRAPERLPHIVVVQSESFFDPRRLPVPVPAETLANYDTLRREGRSGRLAVPAWGAYTMRGEFAFLSGIPPRALGVHRFNPYRRYARRRVPSIAWALKSLGYRTVCIHPYPASFFARDRVFGHLGFEQFVDIRGFSGASRAGPYIADREVTRKVLDTLKAGAAPAFVFAITMENHGPLHFEAAAGEDDLAVYLRHLANADAMFGKLTAALASEGVLCVYGDHVPSMPAIYAAHRFDDSRTDYLVWRRGMPDPGQTDLAVEELGSVVLRVAGLEPDG